MNIQGKASISQDGTLRWWLERTWGSGKPVCWIMLNPSTADAEKDDPTIKRITTFSKRWGYTSLVVVNLFPFRTSSPNECREWLHGKSTTPNDRAAILDENYRIIDEVAEQAGLIMCAWGAPKWAYSRGQKVAKRLREADHQRHILGMNANNTPKHPLARGKARVPATQVPIRWGE